MKLTIPILFILLCSFAYAAEDEIFIHGVLRNATDNNLTEGNFDIYLNITNSSDGELVYEKTNANIFVDDGVYHTVFDGIVRHDWFLNPVSFVIKMGTTIFTNTETTPVLISHAAYVSNDSKFLNGKSDYYRLATDVTDKCYDTAAEIYTATPHTNETNSFNTSAEMIRTINKSGDNYNISIPCSLILDDNSGGDTNFCADAAGAGSFNPTLLVIANESMLQNESIVRQQNITWVTDQCIDTALEIYTEAPHTNLTAKASYVLTPHTNLTGAAIYTLTPHTNLTAAAIYGLTPHNNLTATASYTLTPHNNLTSDNVGSYVVNESIVRNGSDTNMGRMNVSTNITSFGGITMANASGHTCGWRFNGSCIITYCGSTEDRVCK